MIRIYQSIAGGIWLIFCIFWLVAAFGAKRNVARRPWWVRVPMRAAILLILLVIFGRTFRGDILRSGAALLSSPALGLAGLLICALGIGYAIWARIVIGRNWGMPMTLKEGHELVTAGPYAQVRHPIYFGILLALLGSALVISILWLPIFLLNALQFLYAARKEEQLMLETFPDTYPAYMRRTRMLIPFVL
jgi:protein-S-isoprenylcysteine O-methyltransferase Ste14